MITFGILGGMAFMFVVGWIIVGSYVSQRHWKRVIAAGDETALLAALEEALETWRRMRPPAGIAPADWNGLQSTAVVATDGSRLRLSLIAEPDVRVIEGRREQVGPRDAVARRIAVTMVERMLFEIPLARFDAVQVDIYAEYRSPDGHSEHDCILTTQVTRADAAVTEWDDTTEGSILASWGARELRAGETLDPDDGALITAAEHVGPSSAEQDDAALPAGRSAAAGAAEVR